MRQYMQTKVNQKLDINNKNKFKTFYFINIYLTF